MGHIKEPKGVDFIIQSRPLTEVEELAISEHIRNYKLKNNISKSKPVIIHCRSGARSAAVISELEKKVGFSNLYNLKGGILAYSREIDPSIEAY